MLLFLLSFQLVNNERIRTSLIELNCIILDPENKTKINKKLQLKFSINESQIEFHYSPKEDHASERYSTLKVLQFTVTWQVA